VCVWSGFVICVWCLDLCAGLELWREGLLLIRQQVRRISLEEPALQGDGGGGHD
jgi:hypothetical protein